MNTSVFVGIDVAKRYLDVHVLPKNLASRYTNTGAGIGALVKMFRKHQPELVVLEATGKLEIPAAAALFAAGIPVAIVNPRNGPDVMPAIKASRASAPSFPTRCSSTCLNLERSRIRLLPSSPA